MTKNGTLSPKQARFLAEYFTSSTVKDAAWASGVSIRQAERYLQDPGVKAALVRLTDDRLRQAAATVADAAPGAVAVLRSIMDDVNNPPSVRSNAAGKVTDAAVKLAELVTFAGRLDDLEGRIRR